MCLIRLLPAITEKAWCNCDFWSLLSTGQPSYLLEIGQARFRVTITELTYYTSPQQYRPKTDSGLSSWSSGRTESSDAD